MTRVDVTVRETTALLRSASRPIRRYSLHLSTGAGGPPLRVIPDVVVEPPRNEVEHCIPFLYGWSPASGSLGELRLSVRGEFDDGTTFAPPLQQSSQHHFPPLDVDRDAGSDPSAAPAAPASCLLLPGGRELTVTVASNQLVSEWELRLADQSGCPALGQVAPTTVDAGFRTARTRFGVSTSGKTLHLELTGALCGGWGFRARCTFPDADATDVTFVIHALEEG